MNEENFIHYINEKTKDLEIPKNVSPEAMQNRLDEAFKNNPQPEPRTHGQTNQPLRRLAAAACITLCLVASITIFRLTGTDSRQSSKNMNAAESVTEDDIPDAMADEELTGAAGTPADNLACLSGLTTPKSYDEYYTDVKTAYDAYYDRISSVVTDTALNGSDWAAEPAPDQYLNKREALEEASYDDTTDTAVSDLGSKASLSAQKPHSDTNRQEKNVDEGDIIKTDGTYIYRAVYPYADGINYSEQAYCPTHISITKADKGRLEKAADIPIPTQEEPASASLQLEEFYVQDNRLIALYNKKETDGELSDSTYIEIYDITSREKPKKIKELSQSGMLLSSRISGGYLYTISDCDNLRFSERLPYENYIPCVNGSTIACNRIYYEKDSLPDATKVITSLKVSDGKSFTDTLAVPGTMTKIYASERAIYFYESVYETGTKTKIFKVSYEDGKLTAENGAVIAGSLYGAFAINEYDGNLRIVATIPANNLSLYRNLSADFKKEADEDIAEISIKEDVNVLYILDGKLNLMGKITGIAPGEVIHSARFMGDTGYFVTYKNTDPLFSVDLSDPTDPKIIGTLKIPGFSSYLHFYGDSLLLGIGEETDPETQESLGLKLSMFDISDPSAVKETGKKIIKNAYCSNALSDYKAILVDPAKNLFGFSYWTYGPGNDNDYYSTFTYDDNYGFIETASYKLPDTLYRQDCIRGIYIGNYFYLATDTTIESYHIGSEERIDFIDLRK